jgi:hypothetical protein
MPSDERAPKAQPRQEIHSIAVASEQCVDWKKHLDEYFLASDRQGSIADCGK